MHGCVSDCVSGLLVRFALIVKPQGVESDLAVLQVSRAWELRVRVQLIGHL